MANTKKPEAENASEVLDPWEKVPYKLPRITGTDEMVFVSINDYSCTIRRGEKVEIPRFVAAELDRSEAAKEELDRKKDSLLEQAK